MRINKDALKAMANKISKGFGISQNIVYNRFFFDAFLLIQAFKETCHYRNFSLSKSDALALVDEISRNKQIGARWLAYCKNVKYTADLSFQDVLMSIREWIKTVF